MKEDLELTKEQQKELDAIEKDLKAKLEKLLTAAQKKKVEEFRPRFGPPKGGPDGPPPKDGPDGPPPPKKDMDNDRPSDLSKANVNEGGIQWFATLEIGLAEAKRTGKPILFVSAAPHCGGVPGMW